MIDLEDLRSFVQVVESGGFNRAARHLGLSKSILSRRIAGIETDLGARLLTRGARGINPTEAGLEFKSRSERILAELEEAREAVGQLGGGVVGRLRLSAPLSFGLRHAAPVLTQMARQHPRLELDVSYTDRIVDVIGEHYDAAIRIGALKDSSIVARRIGPARGILVASADYLNQRGRPTKPDDLLTHECLIYTGSTVADWPFRSGKRTIGIRPNGRLRSDNGGVLLRWAVGGLGIAYLPSFEVADAVEHGAVEPLLLDYPAPEVGIYVVRPPGSYVSGKVRLLIDTLVEHFGGEAKWDRCLMALNKREGDGSTPAG
jgi:DNA-binding transcriptional LysR family regulator